MTIVSLQALFFHLTIFLHSAFLHSAFLHATTEGPGAVPRCGPGTGVPDCDIPFDATAAIVLSISAAMLLIGLLIQYRIRANLRSLTQERLQAAAERISTMLGALGNRDGRELQVACRNVVADLLTLLKAALDETTRHCYVQPPQDEETWRTIYNARSEVIEMESRLKKASFLLHFKSQLTRGHQLTVEAVERYVSVFTPAMKELHRRDAAWQKQIRLFEIEPPKGGR